uniref:Coenzyme Q-binding protein COQ10 START domain-containing protein n=1 Tax=Timspurckia oligopyrenoides TaxID=708627 RepID=A0A7S0ZKY6_9RHOD|mmetsp:Transcript_9348/g.16847  ORF Transcript_9348/g.16847 Transcript_9348/m.16847 type:complete len:233 (+) Transcript_9348:112-810(+)
MLGGQVGFVGVSGPRCMGSLQTVSQGALCRRIHGSTMGEFSRVAPAMSGFRGGCTMLLDPVQIEKPDRNTRTVKCGVRISAPLAVVWDVLTAYDQLAEVVPNLAISRQRAHPHGGIRVEQCGVQSILGFQFKASVVMDMQEIFDNSKCRRIVFSMVDSRDFKRFEGTWAVWQVNPRVTRLTYSVTISPRGLVPVSAVEWRIMEDVPTNLAAVKNACEKVQIEVETAAKVNRV